MVERAFICSMPAHLREYLQSWAIEPEWFEIELEDLRQEVAMSKLKNPKQKKLASLALDRRNVYGENDKASRRLIPQGKQRSRQGLRRAAKQPLLNAELINDEDSASSAGFEVQTALIQAKRKSFKKRPDAPLGAVLKDKSEPYVPVWQSADRLGVYREILDPTKRKIDRS